MVADFGGVADDAVHFVQALAVDEVGDERNFVERLVVGRLFLDSRGNGSELTSLAFSTIPIVGKPVLVVGLITFTFSTMLGWYYYGERCAVYLFGEKAILVYKIIWVAGIFAGSLAELKFIWNIADILNGLMSIPNIVAVLLLSGVIASETKKYGIEIEARFCYHRL